MKQVVLKIAQNLHINGSTKSENCRIMKLRKSTLLLGLMAIIVAGLTACNQTTGEKSQTSGTVYYRSLLFSETPWDIERGTRELTPDEAMDVNSYKFIYDNNGRLLSVEFVRGDELLGYSSMGGAAKITYEYSGNKQIKRFFNDDNQPIESAGVFTAEYTLDERGTRTGLKFYGKDGQPVENRNKIHSFVWVKLDDGMIQEKRYNLANEETIMNQFCPFYELRFAYNEKGYVVKMANYMGDTLYNCTAENCGDIGVSYFTFEPNEHGDVERFSVYNVTGQMSNLYWGWSRRVSKFDKNGYVLETELFDQDNEYVGGKSVPVTQNVYDRHGALIETKSLDKDRNLINNPSNGVAITEYKYDEKGNRIETNRYDRDRKAVAL
jgi:YD repeat-containing protein